MEYRIKQIGKISTSIQDVCMYEPDDKLPTTSDQILRPKINEKSHTLKRSVTMNARLSFVTEINATVIHTDAGCESYSIHGLPVAFTLLEHNLRLK